MSSLLADKVAIVTGAAGGLGKAIAKRFLEAGAKVVLTDIVDERLKAANDELASSGTVHAVKADITQEQEVKKLFDNSIEKFGAVHILVNNAGVMDYFDAAGGTDKELWDEVIAVNLTAPFLTSKYAVNHFAASEPAAGVILNVASTAAMHGGRAGVAYTSSKHGLIGLTKNTAAFYGTKGVRCNVILPSGMQTDMVTHALTSDKSNQEHLQVVHATAKTLSGYVDLADVAETVLFLCSDASKGVNGALVPVDKGWTAY